MMFADDNPKPSHDRDRRGAKLIPERLVPVAEVVAFLARAAVTDATRLVVGCGLDDDTGEAVEGIVAIDQAAMAVTLAGGRRVLLRHVRVGDVIDARPGAPLLAAIEAARSPAEMVARADRASLGGFGIDASKLRSTDDVGHVLAFMRMVTAGKLPDREARFAFFSALRVSGERRQALIAAENLAEAIRVGGKEAPADLYWQRAWFLRAAGLITEAIAASEVLYTWPTMNPGARKILATTRAAALLDLHQMTGKGYLLEEAKRAAAIAYAISQDEEVRQVYRRLHAFKADVEGRR